MEIEPNGRIIGFRGASPSPEATVCELCGLPRSSGQTCQQCGVRLIDLALSGTSEESLRLTEEDSLGNEPEPDTFQRLYGHYAVCEASPGEPLELGRGSMGITYKAIDTSLGCAVALKVINRRYVTSAGARTRFLREARTAARLRHRNIASVFHLDPTEENSFYAMEYIEGETLEARVRRQGPLSGKVALSIVAQCARALQFAHEDHFIHRDIKPTNIMLEGGRQISSGEISVKVIDFGLVKAIAESGSGMDLTLQGYFAGTPHYASPEQLESGTADERSDIYSLGKCLWFMLAGQPPPPALRSLDGVPAGRLVTAPGEDLPNELTGPLSALLNSMVSPDPRSRPQSASLLLERISDCQSVLSLPQEGRIGKSRHKQRRSRFHWLLGFASVVALLVGFAFILGRGRLSPTGRPAMSQNPGRPSLSPAEEAHALAAAAFEFVRKHNKADNQQAVDLYNKALARFPGSAEAHAGLAYAYFEGAVRFGAPATQLDQAVASAQRAIALDPRLPTGFQALGAIRNYQGQSWEALTQLHRALELDAKSPTAMCDFSLLWSAVGEPQWGLPWAKATAQVEPANFHAWDAAAEACVDLCADDQAEEYYRKCIEIKPVWIPAHCGLMHLHLLRGEFPQAREEGKVIESLQPGLNQPLTIKAQIALFSGEYAEAEVLYRQLLTMNRQGLINYYSGISYLSALGFLRDQAGDTTESHSLLEEAATQRLADADGPQGIYDLAAIRAIEGRKEDALSLLHQAISSGWKDHRATRLDPRFKDLRGEARFGELLETLAAHVTQIRQEAETLCARPINLADYPVRPPQK